MACSPSKASLGDLCGLPFGQNHINVLVSQQWPGSAGEQTEKHFSVDAAHEVPRDKLPISAVLRKAIPTDARSRHTKTLFSAVKLLQKVDVKASPAGTRSSFSPMSQLKTQENSDEKATSRREEGGSKR